ncbi:TipAS antibiotic-recognition domain-containing protein [Deinococcus sp. KNUC1210]|uniref:TipAS antibiotic-recognition domain-containing protein n=1 Tax=Deinococcus sp. KNUC1210 TaxID=2917691 RepID=UPI001EEF884A|nr:TipAS antibiotic-recognition domain-containing protein [Deinococcus sp. KNUC1210]ULH14396.1 TipAS antibiotic-recognition domain-containing protein [Deinococcus sp. KNUC1210]
MNGTGQDALRRTFEQSYAPDALERLRSRPAAERARTRAELEAFWTRLHALIAAGQTPDSAEAQALAGRLAALLHAMKAGDDAIGEGMQKSWQAFTALPAEQQPAAYRLDEAGRAWIREAMRLWGAAQGQPR